MIYLNKKDNVKYEDGDWWYYGNGARTRLSAHIDKLARRMFVGGKYIKQSHPWYKPGRYKTFNDVAFQNLADKNASKSGYIYIIKNPAWDKWIKIGRAIDFNDRLKAFQTYSPFRDYKVFHYFEVDDYLKAENEAHKLLKDKFKSKQEWYQVDVDTAVKLIEGHLK